MKSELFEVSPVQKEIKIAIEPNEVKPVYQKVLQQYSKLAQVPGFRKGFAPAEIIKNRYRDDIQNEVIRELLPDKVAQAIQEHELNPLSEPQLRLDDEQVNLDNGLNVSVAVEVMPHIENLNYKGLEVVRRMRPTEQLEEETARIIEQRRKEYATLAPVEDRAAEIGDTLTIDVRGKFADDEEAEPIEANDLEIELGGAGVEETFTENLIGASPDEEKTFTLEYPADFSSPALAGRKVEYTATIKSLGKVEMPEPDDEFAKSLDEGFETYDDFTAKTREDVDFMAKVESDNRVRDELTNAMIDANPVTVPPTLINYQAQGLAQEFASKMEQQGIDMKNADQKLWTMLFQRMLPQAEREVRGAMLLNEVATLENVEISADEVNEEIETIAKYSNKPAEEVRESLKDEQNQAGLNERLRNRKAVEILVNSANITDGEWLEEVQPAIGGEQTANDEGDETNDETESDVTNQTENVETVEAEKGSDEKDEK